MNIIRNSSSSVYKPISIIRTSRHPSRPHIPFRALATTSTAPARPPGRAFSAATTTYSALGPTRDFRALTTHRMFATSAQRADQPKTYSLQPKVPRLPVPDLEKSLEAYLKSLIPVMEQKYDSSAMKKKLSKRQLYIRDFISPTGLGQTLQNRLLDLDHVSPNNWLNDTLWLALAYHTWRAPLIVNSNWWLMFGPDPSDPEPPVVGVEKVAATPENNPTGTLAKGEQGGGQEWIDKNPKGRPRIDIESQTKWADITDHQIAKAAWIVRRFAEFREKLAKEEIAPDATKAGPLCMEQYRKLFNFARVPLPGCDAFSRAAPQAVHISLLIDDLVYSVDVCEVDASVTDVPTPLPVETIKRRIQSAVEDARKVQKQGGKRQRVGVLTADERDTWTINREKLIAISPSNRSVLESLSTSMFALSLDNYTLPSIPPQTHDPLYLPAIDAQVHNAGTGIHGGQNRWFDKAISVVVETNGRAGVMGEHSPVDALIPSIVVEYVLAQPVPPALIRSESSDNVEPSQKGWQSHKWTTDEEMDTEIQAAQRRAQKIVLDSDASQLWWNEYGTEWIKKNAKCAPDAYIQQALQLAWFREQGYATATYESGSTRGLLHGRTDVIRTLTEESREFVKNMQDGTADAAKRYASLSKACQTHSNITRTVSAGHGFDRHIMGLKTRLRPGETHALFEDELYAKSQEWKLSTSGLSAGGQFTGTGFGAAWPDGYGINYLAGPYLFKFGIESKYSNEATSTSRFKHHIVQALRDMREVCEAALGEQPQQVKAKL